MLPVRCLHRARIDLLEPRDQRKRHGLLLRGAGAEQQHRRRAFFRRRLHRRGCLARARATSPPPAVPIAAAMPCGSMIMITEPSPRIVLPENMAMWLRFGDIGLTTISSVWNTPSTTTPKISVPICSTTMNPDSGIDLALRDRSPAASSGARAAAACRASAAPAYPSASRSDARNRHAHAPVRRPKAAESQTARRPPRRSAPKRSPWSAES